MNVKCFMIEYVGSGHVYRRLDTGETYSLENKWDHPVGAMWYADAEDQPFYTPGPDGRTLFVQTPGGSWNIDARASNCGSPEDNVHRCWVRHGVPPMITVDKNGNTCVAGAGSIAIGDYHGFLKNGELTDF